MTTDRTQRQQTGFLARNRVQAQEAVCEGLPGTPAGRISIADRRTNPPPGWNEHARTLANGKPCVSAEMMRVIVIWGEWEWEEREGAGVWAGGRKTDELEGNSWRYAACA
jgi:hypothetical protein